MATPLPVTPSLLNTFLTCPYQYMAKYVTKEVVFVQNDAAKYGDRVHKAVERALNEGTAVQGIEGEAAFMQPLVAWCQALAARDGVEMRVEQQLALTRNFEPVDWWGYKGKKPWIRGIADVFFIDHVNKQCIVVDWKTGKPKHDKTQANILATCASKISGYSKVLCMWVFVKHDELLTSHLDLVDLVPVQETLADVARYERACAADQFPATRNGLCGKWCDVTSCVHNGKNGGA